jgi:hypothetical protein
MKKLILILIVFHLCMSVFTQKWGKTIGYPNRMDWANDLIEYYDNGYFLVGGYMLNQNVTCWNIKTDINGNILWDKNLINLPGLMVFATVRDNDGNTYICGGTTVNGFRCPLLVKFNSCGQTEWCKMYYDTYFTIAGADVDMIINNNNEIIVLATVENEDQVDQIFLFGYNTDGDYLWKQSYASLNDYPLIGTASGYSLISIQNEYLICGYCYWPYPDDPNHVWLRPFFIGVDSLFNEKWILPFAVMDSVIGEAYSAVEINDSIIMGIGNRWFDGYDLRSLLMFFDNNGHELGYKIIPNEAFNQNVIENGIRKILRLNDSLFISPIYFEISGDTKHFGEFIYDTAGIVYNYTDRGHFTADGCIIKSFNNSFTLNNGTGNGLQQDIYLYKINENLEMVPLDTNQHTYDSLCPEPVTSGTINLGACDLITDVGEIPTPQEYYAKLKTIPITAYPNPAETEITLAFQNTEYHTSMLIEVHNIYGQKVHSEKIYKGQQQTKLNINSWKNGLYIAVVKTNGNVVGKSRFVVN